MVLALVLLGLSLLGLALGSFAPARPRERLVLLGRGAETAASPRVQLLAGGAFAQPFVERVERLPLGPFAVQLRLTGARIRDGRRVDASLDARLVLAPGSPALHQHGLQALLGRSPQQISEIAAVMLRGKLVVALARHGLPGSTDDLDPLLAEIFFAAAPLMDTIGLELDRDTLAIDVREATG